MFVSLSLLRHIIARQPVILGRNFLDREIGILHFRLPRAEKVFMYLSCVMCSQSYSGLCPGDDTKMKIDRSCIRKAKYKNNNIAKIQQILIDEMKQALIHINIACNSYCKSTRPKYMYMRSVLSSSAESR